MIMKTNGCKDEVARQIQEALREQSMTHDHLAEISYSLKMLIGINQRMLQRIEESSSIPKGHTLTVSQSSPVQSTAYVTGGSDINGVAQGFLLCGPGNISLYSQSSLDIGGRTLIATIPSAGLPVFVPFWHPVKVGGMFAVATDSAAGSILTLATWIEPVGLSGDQYFQLTR